MKRPTDTRPLLSRAGQKIVDWIFFSFIVLVVFATIITTAIKVIAAWPRQPSP